MGKRARTVASCVLGAALAAWGTPGIAIAAQQQTPNDYVVVERATDGSVGVAVKTLTKRAAASLSKADGVISVGEEGAVRGLGQSKSAAAQSHKPWNLKAVDADGSSSDGSGIEVAVIDSGIDFTEEINVVKRANFVPGEDDVSPIFEDITGHGSSVAGVIAAANDDIGTTGVAPGAQIYSAKVLGGGNEAPVSRVVEAIYWAISEDVDIINLSCGTDTNSPALEQACADAEASGVLVIAAAGNEGAGAEALYPAAYSSVISVGASDASGKIASFSSAGDDVEIIAPGQDVPTTADFGGYTLAEGTSMAAPHVSGAAAVLMAEHPSASIGLIREAMHKSVTTANDNGIAQLDLAYAEEIFDEVAAAYTEGQETNIPNNPKVTPSFDSDLGEVDGVWTRKQHVSFIDNANTTELTNTEVKAMKLGARANDDLIGGMIEHPQWHGYWKNKENKEHSNYVESYLYVSRMANAVEDRTSTTISYTPPEIPSYWTDYNTGLSYVTSNDYGKLVNMVSSTKFKGTDRIQVDDNPSNDVYKEHVYTWTQALDKADKYGYNLTKNGKTVRYFLFGMAVHAATDAISHCSNMTKTSGAILHRDKTDGVPNAHSTSVKPNRFVCSQYMAHRVIFHAAQAEYCHVQDFRMMAANKWDGSFYLTNLAEYAKATNADYYEKYQSTFDEITRHREYTSATEDTDNGDN